MQGLRLGVNHKGNALYKHQNSSSINDTAALRGTRGKHLNWGLFWALGVCSGPASLHGCYSLLSSFWGLLQPYKMQLVKQVSVGGRLGSVRISFFFFFFFCLTIKQQKQSGKIEDISELAMHSAHAKGGDFCSLLTPNLVFTCWLSWINLFSLRD